MTKTKALKTKIFLKAQCIDMINKNRDQAINKIREGIEVMVKEIYEIESVRFKDA